MTNSLFVVFSHRFRRVVTCDSFGEKKRFRTIDAAIWKFTHIHHWNRKKYEENICDRFGCMRIDCALDNAELPASLWVIEEPIVKRKTKMVFLFFFWQGKKREETAQRRKQAPHLHRISCHFLWRELRPKSVFSSVRVTRISWNWNDLKHCAFACETFGIVVSMNECRAAFQSFRERTMGKTLHWKWAKEEQLKPWKTQTEKWCA